MPAYNRNKVRRFGAISTSGLSGAVDDVVAEVRAYWSSDSSLLSPQSARTVFSFTVDSYDKVANLITDLAQTYVVPRTTKDKLLAAGEKLRGVVQTQYLGRQWSSKIRTALQVNAEKVDLPGFREATLKVLDTTRAVYSEVHSIMAGVGTDFIVSWGKEWARSVDNNVLKPVKAAVGAVSSVATGAFNLIGFLGRALPYAAIGAAGYFGYRAIARRSSS